MTYPIATICGTLKLAEDMRTMAEELTRQGYLVLAPHVLKDSTRLAEPKPISGVELDRMHRARIDMADLVVFVTQERQYVWGECDLTEEQAKSLYFGESTLNELAYARSLSKDIKAAYMIRRNYKDTVEWLFSDQLPATGELEPAQP